MKKQNKSFKTTDITLSAYLLAIGHNLVAVEKNGQRGIFIFLKGEVEKDSQIYMNGQAMIEPGIYNMSIRKLKAKLGEIIFN